MTFVSTRLDTEIYLVHGFEAAGEAAESFEKIGVAPMTIRLAPGVYTIQTSSPSTSLGYERVRVDGTPMKIELRPGDETVKTLGGVFEGLGVTGILLAVIVAISISPHDQNFDRWAIAVPAFAGGLGSLGLGVGLSVVGSTRIVLPRASAQATTAGIVFRF